MAQLFMQMKNCVCTNHGTAVHANEELCFTNHGTAVHANEELCFTNHGTVVHANEELCLHQSWHSCSCK
jgi:hypothetical protein